MKLISGVLAAGAVGLSLALTVPALAQGVGEDFSIDESVIPGSVANVVTPIDRITFDYDALIDQSNDQGGDGAGGASDLLDGDAFAEKGFAQWTSYQADAGPPLSSQLTALGVADYNVYMVFEATGTAEFVNTGDPLTSGIYATFSSFTIDIYLDPDSDTTLALPADVTAGDGIIAGSVVVVDPGLADDALLGSATLLSFGEAHLFGSLAGGDFEIIVTDLGLSLFGDGFFSSPVPFYTIMNFRGVTGTVTPPGSATTGFTSAAEGEGSLFFRIPEPGTLGLLGGGLLAAAALLRRRQAAKAA